jgi:hypothetical protein
MPELSPTAQAVLDAMYEVNMDFDGENATLAAAALEAAADQVVPYFDEPDWGFCDEMGCDIELYTEHMRKRSQLLAIAAELEAQ